MPKFLNIAEKIDPERIEKTCRVALAGNPNSGKTSIFNALTGARQRVGNYPGVTVERREGFRRCQGLRLEIVDLPGTYSLATTSEEERIAREVLVNERPDVVVSVIDASNLERNLYFTVQLLELGLPVVVALNMVDVARDRGVQVDTAALTKWLRVPVVETVGRRGRGIPELVEAVRTRAAFSGFERFRVDYGTDMEREIDRIEGMLEISHPDADAGDRRSIALAVLENPEAVVRFGLGDSILRTARDSARKIERRLGEPTDIVIAERRHGAASGVCRQSIRSSLARRRDVTQLLDNILVHRMLGLPIFLAAMYLVFLFTFTVADPLATAIEDGFGRTGAWVNGLWPAASESLLRSLVVDGIIGGVGGVLVFLPNIVLLFLAISLLEDSGYMARAAFLMDRLMRGVGLHGKSFIPMLLGFGCTVPAIMATRTIESRRARLTTMMVLPLMSCGARLPIYALIIPAFFPAAWQAPVLWVIYFSGVGLALVLARLLRSTLFSGEGLPFVMELPPYRMPTVRSIVTHMWERAWMYLRKAGTVILAISIVMWALSTFPRIDVEPGVVEDGTVVQQLDDEEAASLQLRHSCAGRIGQAMEPVVNPMGFDWKIATALVGAFAAKEVFVAQMGIVNSVGDAEEAGAGRLREQLRQAYTPLVGLCVMLFCLISAPCMATLAVTRRESGSWRWAAFQFVGLTVVAWVLTTVVYQAGSALGLGG